MKISVLRTYYISSAIYHEPDNTEHFCEILKYEGETRCNSIFQYFQRIDTTVTFLAFTLFYARFCQGDLQIFEIIFYIYGELINNIF